MASPGYFSFLISTLILMVIVSGCSFQRLPETQLTATPPAEIHSRQFGQEVIQVTSGVYVAVGFGPANVVLIEGSDGIIIVDTMESEESAILVKAAFTEITKKPVKAIIYTHFHSDHTFGATIMAGKDNPKIYAHHTTENYLNQMINITRGETINQRIIRQLGDLLPSGVSRREPTHSGLSFGNNGTPGLLYPTRTYNCGWKKLNIAGIRMILIHAPGETPDQTIVWLPEKKVMLAGDNFYNAFPNLHAMRGMTGHNATLWIQSLDTMRNLRPEFLVPSHALPIKGTETIYETLTHYRDAIQFVHDQTIRLMNAGLPSEEIALQIKLPAHLARLPYLQENPGTIEWSVRAIYDSYSKWHDGNVPDLFPISPREKAERLASLAGGKANLLDHAKAAVTAGDYQWALLLTDQLSQLDPGMTDAPELREISLRNLEKSQVAATGRNYYPTEALEAKGRLRIEGTTISHPTLLHNIPMSTIFHAMIANLDPGKSANIEMVAGFRFPDTNEVYTVHVRNGIAEIRPQYPDNPDLAVTVDSHTWKEVMAGQRNATLTIMRDATVDGGTIRLARFLSLFN